MSDLKMTRNQREAKTAARPKMSIMQFLGSVYGVRATEYGADKYARGNYHGAPPAGVDPAERAAEYVDAALRHLMKVAQAINIARGTGGDLAAAIGVVDDDASGGFPPSMLPHIAHAIAGLKILVECAVHDGLLPADPGQPWKVHPMYEDVLKRRGEAVSGLVQKNDPDAERRRVLDRRAPEPVVSSAPIDTPTRRTFTGSRRAPAGTFEHVEALAAIPKEAKAFDDAVEQLDKEIEEGFRQAHPDYPKGVDL